jgi:hypothetical protein
VYELAVLALVVVVLMAATTAAVAWIGPAVLALERTLLVGSIFVILYANNTSQLRYSPIRVVITTATPA